MFDNVGWGEVLLLALVAVIIFGPDKLPKAAADLARMIRAARGWAQQARSQLDDELGPEFRDLDLTALHPRTFVRRVLLDDDDDPLGLKNTKDEDDDPIGPTEDEDAGDEDPLGLGKAEATDVALATEPQPRRRAPYDMEAT